MESLLERLIHIILPKYVQNADTGKKVNELANPNLNVNHVDMKVMLILMLQEILLFLQILLNNTAVIVL